MSVTVTEGGGRCKCLPLYTSTIVLDRVSQNIEHEEQTRTTLSERKRNERIQVAPGSRTLENNSPIFHVDIDSDLKHMFGIVTDQAFIFY